MWDSAIGSFCPVASRSALTESSAELHGTAPKAKNAMYAEATAQDGSHRGPNSGTCR
jgi:hypothetical protein